MIHLESRLLTIRHEVNKWNGSMLCMKRSDIEFLLDLAEKQISRESEHKNSYDDHLTGVDDSQPV